MHTRDFIKGAIRDTCYECIFRPYHMHGIDMLSANVLYDLSVNGLDVLSINLFPRDVHGLHAFSVTGLKRLSVNVFPRDVIESVNVLSESGLPDLNGLGTE